MRPLAACQSNRLTELKHSSDCFISLGALQYSGFFLIANRSDRESPIALNVAIFFYLQFPMVRYWFIMLYYAARPVKSR